ncbi:uncharacterized protein LOC132953146 [Metopolophium dirhodum]|uniref:uncharacterized protein LOC132953146 n=1 Tax=Metopolophium dirhodum TaxID=44670 RepID=UPI00298FA36A|nr:uncharacterized protein LOC132953146 [Metopolophium dirhodum]
MGDNIEEIDGQIPEVEGCMPLQPEEYVSSRQRVMIVNIYKDIISDTPDKKYVDVINRIRELTGLEKNTIQKTISEYKTTKTVSSPNRKRLKTSLFQKIDDLDRTGIRRKIHSVWLNCELPTIDRILLDVNADPSLPNFKRTSLYCVIKKLDFVFTKRKRCSVLTEREDLIVWRRRYLYDVRKYRAEGRTIYYLDDTWLNTGDCVDRVWKDNTVLSKHDAFNKGLTTGIPNPTGKGKRLIVLHIGSENGFLPGGLLCFVSKKNTGDYHDEMNGANFKEWFESIIPVLDPNSIIVMDNAPYHSEWLISKDVVCERPLSALLKPELLAIAKELRPQCKSYIIDNLAKDNGHTVLRLPPYHCEFNPIELAWAMVKGYVKQNNTTFKIDDVRQLLNTAIERVTPLNWKNFIKHVIEEEDTIWKADDIMDDMIDAIEPCIMTITGETTSTDFSE